MFQDLPRPRSTLLINHDKDALIEIIVDDFCSPSLSQTLVLVQIMSCDHKIETIIIKSQFIPPDKNHFQAVEFYAEWTLMPSNVSYQVTFYF